MTDTEGTMRYITIALAKGRLADLTVDLLEQAGLEVSELRTKTRKLIFTDEKNKFKFILVKARRSSPLTAMM